MDYEIETGIVAPRASRGQMEELAERLQEGNSVLVPNGSAATLVRHIKKTHGATSSRIDDKETRVWKMSPKVKKLKEAEA